MASYWKDKHFKNWGRIVGGLFFGVLIGVFYHLKWAEYMTTISWDGNALKDQSEFLVMFPFAVGTLAAVAFVWRPLGLVALALASLWMLGKSSWLADVSPGDQKFFLFSAAPMIGMSLFSLGISFVFWMNRRSAAH